MIRRAWNFMVSRGHAAWIMVGAVVLAVLTVVVALQEPPNALAAGILQAVTIVLSIFASRMFGQEAAQETARERMKPHAVSAWKRMRHLWEALGRQKDAIAEQAERLEKLRTNGDIDFEHVRSSLMALEMLVIEQISTADDAVDDWRELVPEEVERIERVARRRGDNDDR